MSASLLFEPAAEHTFGPLTRPDGRFSRTALVQRDKTTVRSDPWERTLWRAPYASGALAEHTSTLWQTRRCRRTQTISVLYAVAAIPL